ncbi:MULTISPECIES: FeoA family protein [unclassified Sedimentibacter]|uniref:FeoA family protein n=1 Tax=unclassified Sedimentibacter TaxID=2649220 RepID=UPI0027DF804C|nr:FeoA family protein [Sedimentibacter sp. MB35-C1]WMJ76192.1 FeoA family protein [Sedimentibacter sp. MB35-C1]
MSLAMVALGDTIEVLGYRGKDDMKRRLQDMGLVKGERIQVIGENQGGLILLVKGVKVALNKGLASLIMVK